MSPPDTRILLAELDTAAAMIGLIKISRDQELIREYKRVAVRSYRSAMDLIANSPTRFEPDKMTQDRLEQIRQWLEVQGP